MLHKNEEGNVPSLMQVFPLDRRGHLKENWRVGMGKVKSED